MHSFWTSMFLWKNWTNYKPSNNRHRDIPGFNVISFWKTCSLLGELQEGLWHYCSDQSQFRNCSKFYSGQNVPFFVLISFQPEHGAKINVLWNMLPVLQTKMLLQGCSIFVIITMFLFLEHVKSLAASAAPAPPPSSARLPRGPRNLSLSRLRFFFEK